MRACQREIWVIDGVLTQNLNHELLMKVAANFAKIDRVPQGYFYPELFAAKLTK